MRREEKIRLILEFNSIAYLYEVQPLTPLLVGVSGSGKTATAKQILKNAITIIPHTHLPEDISGLPDKVEIDGQRYVEQVPPKWFREGVEIIFDEIDKCSPAKIGAILYLLSNKGLSMNGEIRDIRIILCGQIESGFLERLNSQDAVFSALSRRVVIIPCYEFETAEYNMMKWSRRGIRINRPTIETPGDKILKNFRYEYVSEALRDYVIGFYIWLVNERGVKEAEETAKEIFYYLPIDQILSEIQLDEKIEDIEIKFLIERILNDETVGSGEKLKVLAKYQNKLTALEFYSRLIAIYPFLSVDERSKFLEEFNEMVLMTEEMFSDPDEDAEKVARLHAAATIILAQRDGQTVSPEIIQEFEHEIKTLLEAEKKPIIKVGKEK
jgi:hypothetical protein